MQSWVSIYESGAKSLKENHNRSTALESGFVGTLVIKNEVLRQRKILSGSARTYPEMSSTWSLNDDRRRCSNQWNRTQSRCK